MSIHLKKPYKIIERKLKLYEEHYHIPSAKCVIVPVKEYGEDLACEVHWQDGDSKMEAKQLFFNVKNLEPLDSIRDFQLHELWQLHYTES
jgi:hypothetical protein